MAETRRIAVSDSRRLRAPMDIQEGLFPDVVPLMKDKLVANKEHSRTVCKHTNSGVPAIWIEDCVLP